MQTTQITWNGCDGYICADNNTAHDYDITVNPDGSATLFTTREAFGAIAVVPVDPATLAIDEDGEYILEQGVYVTDELKFWREV